MGEDRGDEVVVVARELQNAREDDHLARGQAEGVDLIVADDAHLPLEAVSSDA